MTHYPELMASLRTMTKLNEQIQSIKWEEWRCFHHESGVPRDEADIPVDLFHTIEDKIAGLESEYWDMYFRLGETFGYGVASRIEYRAANPGVNQGTAS